jgi:hypothetical protein
MCNWLLHLQTAQVAQSGGPVGLERQNSEVRAHTAQQLNPTDVLLSKRKLFKLKQACGMMLCFLQKVECTDVIEKC